MTSRTIRTAAAVFCFLIPTGVTRAASSSARLTDGATDSKAYGSVLNYSNAESYWAKCKDVRKEEISGTDWYLIWIITPDRNVTRPYGFLKDGIQQRTLTFPAGGGDLRLQIGGWETPTKSSQETSARIVSGDLNFQDAYLAYNYDYFCRSCSATQIFCKVDQTSRNGKNPLRMWRNFHKFGGK